MFELSRRAFMELAGSLVLVRNTKKQRQAGLSSLAHEDVRYGPDRRNKLDIYLPDTPGPHPFVVDIHGGGFTSGDKSRGVISAEVLDAGIAIVRINYRFSEQAIWPAQLDDCLEAVAYLRENGGDYDLDTTRLAISGQSAGAFLSVSTALSLIQMGKPPLAVVHFYGHSDFSTMDADMTALGRTPDRDPRDGEDSHQSQLLGYTLGENHEKAHAMGPIGRLELMHGIKLPPLMIRHGDADARIAETQSVRLRDAWLAEDPTAEVDFALVPGAGHGGGPFGEDEVLVPLAAFLARHLT